MSSPNGTQPKQDQPPKARKPVEIRCWTMVIVDGCGEPIPLWVPCLMPIGETPRVSS